MPACVKSSIEIDDTKIEMYLNRCRCFLELQEFAKAIKDFEEVSIIGPSNAEAYFCGGLSLLGKGDYDNAITRFEKAFSNDQTYKMRIPRQIAAAYNNFGTQLRSEKKYEEAFQMFKKAYELNPKGKIETKNLLEKADRLKPNTPEILFSLGETYRLLKKAAEAKSAYRRAMELNLRYKVGAFSPSRYYPELRDW